MITVRVKCEYCGHVDEQVDILSLVEHGCPECGKRVPAVIDEEDNLVYIDLSMGGLPDWMKIGTEPKVYEVPLYVPPKGTYHYQIPKHYILRTVTFICSRCDAVEDLRYIITANWMNRLLDISNIATIMKVPMFVDTKHFQQLAVEIENRTSATVDMRMLLDVSP